MDIIYLQWPKYQRQSDGSAFFPTLILVRLGSVCLERRKGAKTVLTFIYRDSDR